MKIKVTWDKNYWLAVFDHNFSPHIYGIGDTVEEAHGMLEREAHSLIEDFEGEGIDGFIEAQKQTYFLLKNYFKQEAIRGEA